MSTLEQLMQEEDERLAALARIPDSPEVIAKREAKSREEHARGVRLGWWTEDGTPIPQETDSEDEEDE